MTFHVSRYIFFPLSPPPLSRLELRFSDFSRRYFSRGKYLRVLFFTRFACLYRFEILCLRCPFFLSFFFFIINMNFVRISLYSRLPFFPWLHEIYFFEFLFNFSSPVIVAARFLSLFATSEVCDPGTLYQLVPLLDAFNFRSRFLAIKTL